MYRVLVETQVIFLTCYIYTYTHTHTHTHTKNRDEHSYAYSQRSENIYSSILALTLRTA